jgi:hypothetical protein
MIRSSAAWKNVRLRVLAHVTRLDIELTDLSWSAQPKHRHSDGTNAASFWLTRRVFRNRRGRQDLSSQTYHSVVGSSGSSQHNPPASYDV